MDRRNGFTLYELLVCIALIPLVIAVIVGPAVLLWRDIADTGDCASSLCDAQRILSEARAHLANAAQVSCEDGNTGTVLSGTSVDGIPFTLTAKDGSVFLNGRRLGRAHGMRVALYPGDRLAVVTVGLPPGAGRRRPSQGPERSPGVELCTAVYMPNIANREAAR